MLELCYNEAMKRSLISIIIPVFNEEKAGGKFLDERLMPVLEEMPEDFEIVVVDDGRWISRWNSEECKDR